MRLAPLSILVLGFSTMSAPAGDFTGFYAGVNAGYAFGRDGARLSGPATARERGEDASDSALPPSARSAADLLVERREGARRFGAARR